MACRSEGLAIVFAGCALAPVLLFNSCSADHNGTAQLDETAWESALLEHREQKNEEYRTSSTSPMAGTQYLKSEPTDEAWLTREDKVFELAYVKPAAASVRVSKLGNEWRWSALEDGVVCRVDDKDLSEESALEGPASFLVGGLQLSFYPAEERVTFIVFDPDRPEKVAFEQLLYYPPDIRYAVDAQLILLDDPEQIEMLTSRNLIKAFYRYAKIRFRLDGADRELTAFKSELAGADSTALFVPFRDSTSSNETYGAGRFLYIDEPDGKNFVLDFNRSFNPLCNYSPAYNCAVPPRENHLEVAIRAGERTYPH